MKIDSGVIQTILTKSGKLFKNNCDKFLDEVMSTDDYLPSEKEEISDLLLKHMSVQTKIKDPTTKTSAKSVPNIKKNTNEWLEDENLPVGWKYRMKNFASKDDSKRKMFRAPNGNLLRARLQAVEYLVEINASQEDVDKMKNGLEEEEDWEKDQILPDKWLLKYRKKGDSTHGCYFMNVEGVVLRNFQQAHKDLVEKGYDKKYMTNLQTLYKTRKGYVHNNDGQNAIENKAVLANSDVPLQDPLDTSDSSVLMNIFSDELEKSLPYGWKSTIITGGMKLRKFEAPDGKEIVGVLEALKYMTFVLVTPQVDIDSVKSVLVKHEDWEADPRIPEGWMLKKLERYTHYLTKEHDKLYGHGEALEYMLNKGYSNEVVSEFKKNFNPSKLQGKSVKLKETLEKGEDLLEESTEVKTNTNKNLPVGWQFQEKYMDSHRSMFFNVFISPEGVVYRSLIRVLGMMASMEYKSADIETMKSNLVDEGWESDENLPTGWLYKKMDNRVFFFTDKFETIRGHKHAAKYLEDNEYSRTQIEMISLCGKKKKDKLKNKITIEKPVKEEISTTNEEQSAFNESLPDGWMFVDEKLCNPEGIMFESRLEVVEYLVNNEYDPKVVYSLWNTLHMEGWKLGPSLLPMGWRIKFVGPESELGHHFLAREMCVLASEEEVLTYLQNTEDYTTQDIVNFKQWVDTTQYKDNIVSQNQPKRRKFA